ncbi:apolipoprotein N-acyltransferase [bacterium]|nr:apolipoprotein N-acyltransferase [bacterium]
MGGALLAAASAALLLAAAPPFAAAPLALLALAPLLLALSRARTHGRAVALAWFAGALFHLGLLPWLPAAIVRTQGIAWPAAGLLFALFAVVHALPFALVALAARIPGSAPARVAATTAGWVVAESAWPQVLPWSLGAVVGPHPLLRQGADLAGVHGLAALLVAVNALLAEAAARWRAQPARAGLALAAAAMLVGGAGGYGSLRRRAASAAAPGRTARLAVVQAGALPTRAADPQGQAITAWAAYAATSATLAGRADVVLWPESVLPLYLGASPSWRARAEALARGLRAALVIGALDRTAAGEELNAAYVFTPALSAVGHKAVLVPFGEYRPAAVRWVPSRWWRPPAPRRAGPAAAVVDAGIRLAPSICFEAILPGYFNAAVRDGAEALVNLSDDSWFASPWAAAQHLEMTRLRAVETRRWLIRASHSGVSAVIDPRGVVVARLPFARRGTLLHVVDRRRGLTPYARWGDAPLLGASVATLVAIVGGGLWRRRQARSKTSTSASAAALS